LQVYPNPTNDLLIIQTENLVPLSYELSNMRGQVLFKGTFTGQIVLSLGTQPVGTYFLRIINAKGELVGTVWRIIKR
jgi:Secretion system C-terminal sorting domain